MKLVKRKIGKGAGNISRAFTLDELKLRKNKILILRKWGGLGDVINTSLIFKEIKKVCPESHVTYAVPSLYLPTIINNPYIDIIVNTNEVNFSDYGYVADISSDCGKYEDDNRPYVDKHRSDIWAEMSLGIKLTNHDFDIHLFDEKIEQMKQRLIKDYHYNPSVKIAIFPKSASPAKDIPSSTLISLVKLMKNNNLDPCIIHDKPVLMKNLPEICQVNKVSMDELVHLVSLFDYMISVDTGSFHLAAALDIPTVGVFAWTDGKFIGKYHKKSLLIQKHRDDPDGLDCCPCWNWSVCKFRKPPYNQVMPLKCMVDIKAEDIFEKFMKLMETYKIET